MHTNRSTGLMHVVASAWKRDWCYCLSICLSVLPVLLLSALFLLGLWSLSPLQGISADSQSWVSVHLLWSSLWALCCLSSALSFWHKSPCHIWKMFCPAVHQIGKFLFFSCQPISVVSEAKVCDDPATNTDCAMVFFKGICHYALKEDVKQGQWDWEEAALTDPYWCVEPVTHCALHKCCTAGFCIQLFDGVS